MTNCSSAQKLQKETPAEIGQAYFQKWTAGIEGGGSGINLFIPVSNNTIILDSVHFRGRISKLETKPSSPNLFIARFKTNLNQPNDIILSSDPMEESKNKLPEIQKTTPFNLKNDECVVSYTKNDQRLYFKIKGLKEKPQLNYPSAPLNKQ